MFPICRNKFSFPELTSAWFSAFSLKHFSCKVQSILLIQLHVLFWLLPGGWRIFLLRELNVWHATVTMFYIASVENFGKFMVSRKVSIRLRKYLPIFKMGRCFLVAYSHVYYYFYVYLFLILIGIFFSVLTPTHVRFHPPTSPFKNRHLSAILVYFLRTPSVLSP